MDPPFGERQMSASTCGAVTRSRTPPSARCVLPSSPGWRAGPLCGTEAVDAVSPVERSRGERREPHGATVSLLDRLDNSVRRVRNARSALALSSLNATLVALVRSSLTACSAHRGSRFNQSYSPRASSHISRHSRGRLIKAPKSIAEERPCVECLCGIVVG